MGLRLEKPGGCDEEGRAGDLIVDLIGHASTATGLRVRAKPDNAGTAPGSRSPRPRCATASCIVMSFTGLDCEIHPRAT